MSLGRSLLGRPQRQRGRSGGGAGGWSLVELMGALAVLAIALLTALPALAGTLRRERLAGATRSLAQSLMGARWQALAQGRSTGLQWHLGADGALSWTPCQDGDGDGLRNADLADGTDLIVASSVALARQAPGVRAGFPERRAYPRLPPLEGKLDRLDDAVKFGTSDLVSFSPLGSATPGSVYLTDGTDLTALVLNGQTGRLRLFRFDHREDRWKEMR